MFDKRRNQLLDLELNELREGSGLVLYIGDLFNNKITHWAKTDKYEKYEEFVNYCKEVP
jgi:hypothetical protein